jgi:hypothetical protein
MSIPGYGQWIKDTNANILTPGVLSCNRIVISTEAYPDFLPRCAGQGRVCAFLLRKGA